MRFATTNSGGFLIDSPHRILATTDFPWCQDKGDQSQPVQQGMDALNTVMSNEAIAEAARQLAKQMLGRWYANSILGD